ncbi:hypothetical protein SEA_SIXAMA_138 [Gordonia phage Sixama]|uniref:Uncharacterized protein n=1 Tax=Gordonia phage Sixama TaxID=2653271 RepID=A0A5Q2F1A6_9CAUD|nr:hypothetical protein PP302_gp170 [Gordonia phage Sixama]QGF20309.1 hypothetical protein SEA_SIXAMA_138 [Gordonia phage Sixama]
MSYIDLRFHLDNHEEDGYISSDLVAVERTGTDLTQDQLDELTEGLAQSDYWNVDGVNTVLTAMYKHGRINIRD